MKLTREDYTALERSYITRKIADAAGIYRVPSVEGRDIVGRSGSGDYAGIVFPYRPPGAQHSVLDRLRLDNPPIDHATSKAEHKYLIAPTARNRIYFPPCDAALLSDKSVPVIVTEGEKKGLALWRMALETANGTGRPAFLPISLAGVWSWRGVIGARTTATGARVAEKGTLPDFDLIEWQGRKVTILFDSNTATNPSVAAARRELARELTRRGAEVMLADLPASPGVNGCDDFLGFFGAGKLQEVLADARGWDWRAALMMNEKNNPRPILANAICALRTAPAWVGVLAWDEFALRVIPTGDPPWGPVRGWGDQEDRLTTDWLQHNGIFVKINEAAQAVQAAAHDCLIHPVRQYLDALQWDGIARIDDWLTLYCRAEPSDLTRAVGPRWLISAVARIYEPGCQADHVLILESAQGFGKSTALRTIGEPFYSEDLADFTTKDASMGVAGAWIIELPELDAMNRADVSRVKAFVSRRVDRFRPPYGRSVLEAPRQCVFAGSVNHSEYLKDETGGRRFWPVACGRVDLDSLTRDKSQLWAEAVVRHRLGEKWWLDSRELIEAATCEQDDRYLADPWETEMVTWLATHKEVTEVTTADILRGPLRKDVGQWTRGDETRVGVILRRLNWKVLRRAGRDARRRSYVRPDKSDQSG